MSKAYFQMQNLDVGYNRKAIIKNICIDIQRGDIVALIGPNGAGKSTILKSITRQLEIVSGDVNFDGKSIKAISFRELASQMAVVLTDRIKGELMTCHDIVASGRYPYTGRLGILTYEDEEKVDEALAAVNARELGSRDFNAISDGQKQRVLLARAICQEPDVIVLDEPTSFLDVRYKLELLSILKNMAKKKDITVIMSLHEIDLAEKLADKIVCVRGENIFSYGAPEDIFYEDNIRNLYGIDNGFFDPMYGSIELPKPTGPVDTLVISSSGKGIRVYRKLQKLNRGFIAGIIYTNDMDYRLARLLADEVITEKPFNSIGDEAFARAMEAIKSCSMVVDAGVEIGESNSRIQELVDFARSEGKLYDEKLEKIF
ncbi:MAG: ABC transporter ATP-binding protein [Bacillota bacterium]|nr:ABC transporter ATP-binding protein [Bacillota bacterium]